MFARRRSTLRAGDLGPFLEHVARASLVIGVGIGLVGCSTPATNEQCDEFADHMTELFAKTETKPKSVRRRAKGIRDKITVSCLEQGNAEQVACALKYDTLEQVEAHCP